MTLKKLKIIDVIIIILLSIVFHSIYQMFPNLLTAFFFPVNESIMEHMKLFILSYFVIIFFDHYIIEKYYLIASNFLFSEVFALFTNIISFLIMFIPFYYSFGENIVITFYIMILSIIIGELTSYYILNRKENDVLNYISYFLLVIILSSSYLFTFFPPKIGIFKDSITNEYGIQKK